MGKKVEITGGLLSPYLCSRRIKVALPHIKGRVLDMGCRFGFLAEYIGAENYVGFDIDQGSLVKARVLHPNHLFVADLTSVKETFDTVVALAVLEHLADPAGWLKTLKSFLSSSLDSQIVCTTPHPLVDRIHSVGASFGIFSHNASDEHEQLLDKRGLEDAGRSANLALVLYQRFLWGANQLCVYKSAG